MKKLLAIVLLVLYGVSSTGATVQLHYCCGKLKNISFSTSPVKDCGSKHKMGSKPCCETKQITTKDQDQQQDVYTINCGNNAPAEVINSFAKVNSLQVPVTSVKQVDYSSPPLSQSLCILNCVFRI